MHLTGSTHPCAIARDPGEKCELESEAPFQTGASGLDTGTEFSQIIAEPATARHGFHGQAGTLMESDMFDAQALGIV